MHSFPALREPEIHDVIDALSKSGHQQWPQDEEDLLEFFKAMIRNLVSDKDGDYRLPN